MRRMILIGLIVFAGLTVCGLLVLRHAVRTAPVLSDAPQTRAVQPVDRLQESVKLDRHPDYALDAKAKLRREEMRQRPWEGRN